MSQIWDFFTSFFSEGGAQLEIIFNIFEAMFLGALNKYYKQKSYFCASLFHVIFK